MASKVILLFISPLYTDYTFTVMELSSSLPILFIAHLFHFLLHTVGTVIAYYLSCHAYTIEWESFERVEFLKTAS